MASSSEFTLLSLLGPLEQSLKMKSRPRFIVGNEMVRWYKFVKFHFENFEYNNTDKMKFEG